MVASLFFTFQSQTETLHVEISGILKGLGPTAQGTRDPEDQLDLGAELHVSHEELPRPRPAPSGPRRPGV